jgi:predicted O-methyltransferase YrrM
MASSVDTWLKNWRSIINFNYIRDRLDFKFLKDIIRLSVFEYKNPMSPWITIEMIKILENYLKEGDIGFEFGSGSSTIWLAKKTKRLISVEHNLEWFNKIRSWIISQEVGEKVKLIYVSGVDENKRNGITNYLQPILKLRNNSLDYCFVDGLFRDECILKAISKIKSGGILIMDNVDNYFPRNRTSVSIRYKRDNFSRAVSRAKMKKIYSILGRWRCVWTTSAIQDTVMWIKP